MVNEFKLLHAQTRYRSVHACEFTAGQKTVENQDWATRPLCRQATGPRGCRGLRAAGLPRAVGHGPAFTKTLCSIAQSFNDQLTLAVDV